MRVVGDVIVGTDIVVGEIAAPAARHENFFAGLVGVIHDNDLATAFTRFNGAH